MEPFCLWRIRYTKSSIKLEFPIIERIFSLWLGIFNTCSLTCDTNRAHFFCISFFVVPVTSSMNLWLVVDSWVHPWSEVFLCSSGHHPHYKQDWGHRTSSDYPILRSMPRCGVIIKRESDLYSWQSPEDFLVLYKVQLHRRLDQLVRNRSIHRRC